MYTVYLFLWSTGPSLWLIFRGFDHRKYTCMFVSCVAYIVKEGASSREAWSINGNAVLEIVFKSVIQKHLDKTIFHQQIVILVTQKSKPTI